MRNDLNMNDWEVETTQIQINESEYEKRIVRLVSYLIKIDPEVSEDKTFEMEIKEAA